MYRICLVNEKQVNETGDTLSGGINEHFVNIQATHIEIDGEVMEAKAVYGEDGVPLVFIGLDVTDKYKDYLKELRAGLLDSKVCDVLQEKSSINKDNKQ